MTLEALESALNRLPEIFERECNGWPSQYYTTEKIRSNFVANSIGPLLCGDELTEQEKVELENKATEYFNQQWHNT